MADLLIKAPDGRVVTCPRGLTIAAVLDDAAVITVNAAALKPGWSVVEEVASIEAAPAEPVPEVITTPALVAVEIEES